MGGRSIGFAVVAAALWLAAPLVAYPAGLGRLTVLSPLGSPLNAEIELVAQPGEQDIVARLAPPEAFTEAGVEMSPALITARFTIERRGARQFIRVTTLQPVKEPFLDLLVDLQWNTGRLVREYTVLLDPPEFKGRQPIAVAPSAAPKPAPQPVPKPAPVAPSVTKPTAPVEAKPLAPEAPSAPAVAAAPEKPEPAAGSEKPEPAAVSEKPAAEVAADAPMGAATHEVQKGETLGAIAKRNLPPGVSLSQMLVAIYRANEDAFIRGNVNLVRAGRILDIPDIDAVGTVDPEEASRLVREHHAQFNEYRSRLAAVPAPAEAAVGQRDAAGRIEPKPEPATAPAQPKDEVKLSKDDPKKPAGAVARAASEDDRIARERELREAQSRVADLEKNVADLQKLLELKNQQLAELEKKAGAQVAPPAAATAVEKPAAKAPEKPAASPSATPKPAPDAPKPADAETLKPGAAEAPKPAAPTQVAKAVDTKPKPRPVVLPPPPEPSLLDQVFGFLEDPVLLGGLALVIVGLGGYAAWSWKRKKAAQAKFQDSVLGAAVAGAVAGSAGEPGTATAPASVSRTQAPVGMAVEEVDPIAEADVYIAYGRDAQAEEILKEALQKDPKRSSVHAKLIEIYAQRKDAKAFEQTALKLKNLTGGKGPEWDKAAALGRSIDPQNGLYGGAPATTVPVAAAAPAAAPALDFDLGGASQTPPALPDISFEEFRPTGLDIDLGGTSAPAAGGAAAEQDKTVTSIDFNIDLGAEPPATPTASAPTRESSGLDFDLKLDDLPAEVRSDDKPIAPVDLSTISLDLGGGGDSALVAPAGSTDPKWQEVATKLDLAKAYQEMGDRDGARELLTEVMKDGDEAQKGQAEQLLGKLA